MSDHNDNVTRPARSRLNQPRLWGAIGSILALSMLLGCATLPVRLYNEHQQAIAVIDGIPDARFWADDPLALAATRAAKPESDATAMLALSGGGDGGAYGAGFLNGWTQSGKRPEFAIVTGVSTGALLAPFAFLGSRYDDRLKAAFTSIGPKDIYNARFPLVIPFSVSVAGTKPLWRLLNVYFSQAVIDDIAREHRRGRRLFVSTANLDAQRAVVWNMGAIAASTSPDRYRLFRRVILASCAIPAVFPPVIIETRSGDQVIREVHVDGSTAGSLIAVPPALSVIGPVASSAVPDDLYLVVDAQLGGNFRLLKGGVLTIAQYAMSLATSAATREQVTNAFLWSRRNAATFHLSYIDTDFDYGGRHVNFDNAYMNRLYNYGYARGAKAAWLATPPTGDPTKS
jgi:predicted patatin/cPLA2 family phospholipase